MKLDTKYLGEIEVEQSDIIRFPSGIPGFQEETEFVLLNLPGESSHLFQVLQSVKSSELAFIVTNPYYFYSDYEFKLDDAIIDQLEIQKEGEVTVFTIVTVKSPFASSTVNLKAPVIINHNKRLGKQYILNIDKYQTKAPITVQAAEGDK